MNTPSKHLILLRHASAENGEVDRSRALSRVGEAEAAGLADSLAVLAERGFQPQIVLSSPATRARETALRVIEGLPHTPRFEEDESLYLASPGQILSRLQALPDDEAQVLVVGHNPGLAELVQWLVSGAAAEVLVRASRGLTPAAFAALRIATRHWEHLEPGCAELVEFQRPGDASGG